MCPDKIKSVSFVEKDANLGQTVQSVLAITALLGSYYMTFCFLKNKIKIKQLIECLDNFKEFCSVEDLEQIDVKANFIAKAISFYSIFGVLVYAAVPLISAKSCEKIKPSNMVRLNLPCGLIARLRFPFRYDYSPIYEIVITHEICTVLIATMLVSTITTLTCGILVHIVGQLKILNRFVLLLSFYPVDIMEEKLRFCLKYHMEIIDFSKKTNEAFGLQMLMNISLTSMVISVLGFIILIVDNLTDSLRFTLHLLGWFAMLFLICFYGQKLIDEVNSFLYFLSANLKVKFLF